MRHRPEAVGSLAPLYHEKEVPGPAPPTPAKSLKLLSLPLSAHGPAGRVLLGEGPSWEPEMPVWQEAGEFQSLVAITAALSLLTPTGLIRVAKACGLCCRTRRECHVPLCVPKPMPEAVFQPSPPCPRPDAPDSASFSLLPLRTPRDPWHVLPIPVSAPSSWQGGGSDTCVRSRLSLGACPALCGRTGGDKIPLPLPCA